MSNNIKDTSLQQTVMVCGLTQNNDETSVIKTRTSDKYTETAKIRTVPCSYREHSYSQQFHLCYTLTDPLQKILPPALQPPM